MFGIGLPEFILIMVVALIVVGPDKLPGLARTLGKQVLELKKAANSLKDSLQDELVDEKKQIQEISDSFSDLSDDLKAADPPKDEQGDEEDEKDEKGEKGEKDEKDGDEKDDGGPSVS